MANNSIVESTADARKRPARATRAKAETATNRAPARRRATKASSDEHVAAAHAAPAASLPEAPAAEPSEADVASERLSGQFALGRHGDLLPRHLVSTATTVARQASRQPGAVLRATAGLA